MLTTGGLRPSQMNAFTSDVYDVLEAFVLSPWSVLKVECGWRGVDPCCLDRSMLTSLLPKLQAHVARVTDDDNGAAFASALGALLSPVVAPIGLADNRVFFDY